MGMMGRMGMIGGMRLESGFERLYLYEHARYPNGVWSDIFDHGDLVCSDLFSLPSGLFCQEEYELRVDWRATAWLVRGGGGGAYLP